jgi:hypothetical protein
MGWNSGSGRSTELIITLYWKQLVTISVHYKLLLCLSMLYIVSLFVHSVLQLATTLMLAQGTRVEKLPVTSGRVCCEMLRISSRMALKSTGRLLCAVRSGERGGHGSYVTGTRDHLPLKQKPR